MRDDPVVINLVARARDGDQPAWNEIVNRYAPLVWSICNRYKQSRQDIDDISQTVWLLLVEQLGNLRQPAALPGWLATTTQRECFRVPRAARRYHYPGPPGESQMSGDPPPLMIEQEVIAAELNAALRAALPCFPARCRHLLFMLITDPRFPMRRSALPSRYLSEASVLNVRASWTDCAAPRSLMSSVTGTPQTAPGLMTPGGGPRA